MELRICVEFSIPLSLHIILSYLRHFNNNNTEDNHNIHFFHTHISCLSICHLRIVDSWISERQHNHLPNEMVYRAMGQINGKTFKPRNYKKYSNGTQKKDNKTFSILVKQKHIKSPKKSIQSRSFILSQTITS